MKKSKTIYLGADHRGVEIKEHIKKHLQERKINFLDLGNKTYDENDDYPDFAQKVSKAVQKNPQRHRGILICGSGIGMSIAANRFKGIRAGLCLSRWMAEDSRKEDDINILVLAANYTDPRTAVAITESFLKTKFENTEKRKRRIKKIEEA